MSGALAGKRIVNTRAVHQAAVFNQMLRSRGAEPLDYPSIAIRPPEDSSALDAALCDLAAGRYAWLILTSANTVFALAARLTALGLNLRRACFRSAAVGPATSEAARQQLGLKTIDLPAEYVAESLALCLPVESGARVLLPESAIARPTLSSMLLARGAQVAVVTAYRTVCGSGGTDVPRLLARGQIDGLTFTSSSTVTCFLERLLAESGRLQDVGTACIACIGPHTVATARDCGLAVSVAPSEHTLDGLLHALEDFFARQTKAWGNQA